MAKSRTTARTALGMVLLFCLCALTAACRSSAPARSSESQSPDGLWLAVARTGPAGWFDRREMETTVYLERRDAHSNPVDSLWRHQPWRPVTIVRLTHTAPASSGDALVQMRWLTPTHLEVGYLGRARLDYQVLNCSGIQILVEPLGEEASAPVR